MALASLAARSCVLVIVFGLCFLSISIEAKRSSTKVVNFKWEVEYMHWSPDCNEGVVMGINGQFPGPTIRARAGDTVVVELTNKLPTEGVVIHWHGIRQVYFTFSCYVSENFQ